MAVVDVATTEPVDAYAHHCRHAPTLNPNMVLSKVEYRDTIVGHSAPRMAALLDQPARSGCTDATHVTSTPSPPRMTVLCLRGPRIQLRRRAHRSRLHQPLGLQLRQHGDLGGRLLRLPRFKHHPNRPRKRVVGGSHVDGHRL